MTRRQDVIMSYVNQLLNDKIKRYNDGIKDLDDTSNRCNELQSHVMVMASRLRDLKKEIDDIKSVIGF